MNDSDTALVERRPEQDVPVEIERLTDRPVGHRDWAAIIGGLVLLLLLVGLVWASWETGQFDRLWKTALAIVVVVAASGLLFMASNMLVSQATSNWSRYRGLVGALLGAIGGGLLRGNRSVAPLLGDSEFLIPSSETGELLPLDATSEAGANAIAVLTELQDPLLIEHATGLIGLVEWPILGAIAGGIAGLATGAISTRASRLVLPVLFAIGAGWLVADNLLLRNRPDTSIGTIALWTAIGAAFGALIWSGVVSDTIRKTFPSFGIIDRLRNLTRAETGSWLVRLARRLIVWAVAIGISVLVLALIDQGETGSVGWLVAATVAAFVLPRLPRRDPIVRGLAGAAIGATVGAWLIPDALGTGSLWASRLAVIIPLALVALRFAWPEARTVGDIAHFNRRARAFVFLAPALAFISINLVIPAIRTIFTSFLDRESEEQVGLDNYRDLFGAEDFVDTSDFSNLFTSDLFFVGLVLLLGGIAVGFTIHQIRNGTPGIEASGGSVGPVLVGCFLLMFAVFSVVRGTFANTLWWMLTVTALSTALGLLIAVLAERAGRLESTAKSLVFMPLAISSVGASIIWRLQYQPRNISKNQTGVFNAVWIEIGKLSHSGWPRWLGLAILGALVALTAAKIVERIQRRDTFAGMMALLTVVVYLFVELARRSLGGFQFIDGEVVAQTVAFREEVRPFNNVYLMMIMIWSQAGFAMVILSAAIKAVPESLLEAARIDGATESQQFFRVILPQILPTIGVVVTATIVAVAKVFDIVKVSTGGNFGTNVLANDFFTVAFQFFDRGKGSAIAVIILLTVAPILILNVRQMVREAA